MSKKIFTLSTFLLSCIVHSASSTHINDFFLSNRVFFLLKQEYSPLYEKFSNIPDEREMIISSDVNYNNILNNNTHSIKRIENSTGTVKLFFQQPKSGYEMFYTHTRNYLKSDTENSDGITRLKQKLSISGMDMWFRNKHVFWGVTLSTNDHDNYSLDEIQNKPPIKRAFNNPRIDYGFSFGITREKINFYYELSKDVHLATILSFVLKADGSFKKAPFSVYSLRNELIIGATLPKHSLETSIAFRDISSDTLLHSSESFNSETDMFQYECEIKDRFADKLFLELMYQRLTGDIKAYDAMGKTFFYIKGIFLQRVLCNLTYQVDKTLSLLTFNEFSRGKYNKGEVDFTPFSSWPVILPEAYEWYDFSFLYNEAGMAISKMFTLGKYNSINSGISTSYVYGNLETKRREKTIVASIPAIVDEKSITLTNFKGVSIVCDLEHRFEFHRFHVTTSINQLIPTFWLKGNRGGTVYSCILTYKII